METFLKRANAREMRARSVAAVLMGVLDPYLDELSRLNDIVRSVDEGLASSKGDRPRGDVYNALMTTLMELGVEVITDDMRNQVGLPARGPDGWTPDELIALETARLDAILKVAACNMNSLRN